MASKKEELIKVTIDRPSIKNRFLVETEAFILEYLKIKNIEVPDASEPIDVDNFLNIYDETIAKE